MGLNEAAGYVAVAVTALVTGYLAAGVRAAPGTVPARDRVRRARPRACPPWPCARPAGTPGSRRATHVARADGRHDHLHDQLTDRQVFAQTSFTRAGAVLGQPGRAGEQPQRRPGLGPVPRPVRGRRALRGTHRCAGRALPGGLGPRAAASPAPCPTGGAASGSSRRHVGAGAGPRAGRREHQLRLVGDRGGPARAPGRRWSTRPCWPRSGTSPTRPGGPASVGIYRLWRDGGFAVGALLAGVVADLLGVRAAVVGRRRPHRRLRCWSSPSGCTRPTTARRRPRRHHQEAPMGDRAAKDCPVRPSSPPSARPSPAPSASSCSTCSPRAHAAWRTSPRRRPRAVHLLGAPAAAAGRRARDDPPRRHPHLVLPGR